MNKLQAVGPLSFDGCGINGPDEYKSRLCTFVDKNTQAQTYGPLFAAAPELLDALRSLAKEIDLSKLNVRKDFSLMNAHSFALKVIFKAGGQS